VEAYSPFTWFGGKFKQEEGIPFAQFAVDPEKLPAIFTEMKVPAEDYAAFLKDQRACLVGKETADKYKLKVGDRMYFVGQLWPFDLDLRVAGIYTGTLDDRNVLFHHKYLDEAAGSAGQVGTWWVKVSSIEAMPTVIEAINKAFENSSAPVRAETERAFQLSFVSMWGNIRFLVQSICSVVVFTLLLVSASTMSMAVRERFRELAVLKALGYRRRELFAFILAESFGLAMAGAALGVFGAWIFSKNAAALSQGVFLVFELTPRIAGLAFAVAALLGIVASLAPALSVARTSVVQGLKTLD
jgi:putative ABC transport system permease protein